MTGHISLLDEIERKDSEITQLREALAKAHTEGARLRMALEYILKKNPNAVNPLEAADMAVEFHMKAHIALFETTLGLPVLELCEELSRLHDELVDLLNGRIDKRGLKDALASIKETLAAWDKAMGVRG